MSNTSTSDFHFEQPTPTPTTEQTERAQFISNKYGEKTDRELLEEQTHLAQLTTNYNRSIKNNVQFFFWLTIIGIGLTCLVYTLNKW